MEGKIVFSFPAELTADITRQILSVILPRLDELQRAIDSIDDPDRLLTVKEAAAFLACSESFVKKRIYEGTLTNIRLGRSSRIKRSELMRYIEDCRKGPVGKMGALLNNCISFGEANRPQKREGLLSTNKNAERPTKDRSALKKKECNGNKYTK